jgi:hypothetical protein
MEMAQCFPEQETEWRMCRYFGERAKLGRVNIPTQAKIRLQWATRISIAFSCTKL